VDRSEFFRINVRDHTIEIEGFQCVIQNGLGGFSCLSLPPSTAIESPADLDFGVDVVGGNKQNPPEGKVGVLVLENRPITKSIPEGSLDPLSNKRLMTLRV